MYSYHYVHTLEDFLADIGGYCDLFLGLSVLRFVLAVKGRLKKRLLLTPGKD